MEKDFEVEGKADADLSRQLAGVALVLLSFTNLDTLFSPEVLEHLATLIGAFGASLIGIVLLLKKSSKNGIKVSISPEEAPQVVVKQQGNKDI